MISAAAQGRGEQASRTELQQDSDFACTFALEVHGSDALPKNVCVTGRLGSTLEVWTAAPWQLLVPKQWLSLRWRSGPVNASWQKDGKRDCTPVETVILDWSGCGGKRTITDLSEAQMEKVLRLQDTQPSDLVVVLFCGQTCK